MIRNPGDTHGIQQEQTAGFMGDDGDFAFGVVLRHVQIGQALGGERASDAVDIERHDVLLHPLAVQRRVAAPCKGIQPA